MLIEEVTGTGRVQFGVLPSSSGGSSSLAAGLLFLLVVTVAPFKLLIRAEALRRDAFRRFLRGLASVTASPEPRVAFGTRLPAVLMLAAGEAEVATADVVSVVMDAPCDCEPLPVAFTQDAAVVDGSPGAGLKSGE